MASGAAVITTRKLAIPEVGGDAVIYVEPTANSIRDAMRSLVTDPDRSVDLRSRAILRATLFTWSATARAHVAAYATAAQSPESR
jgi:glycosyltransferase involved in cell wall biosynthesis